MSLFIDFDITFTKYHEPLIFITGVFFGSLLWWLCTAIIDELLTEKRTIKFLRYLNYTSDMIIFSFGLYTLYQLHKLNF